MGAFPDLAGCLLARADTTSISDLLDRLLNSVQAEQKVRNLSLDRLFSMSDVSSKSQEQVWTCSITSLSVTSTTRQRPTAVESQGDLLNLAEDMKASLNIRDR